MTALLKQRPLPTPAVLDHLQNIPGYRAKFWVMPAEPPCGEERGLVLAFRAQVEDRLRPARREVLVALLTRLAVGSYPEAMKDPQAFGIRVSDLADDLMEFSELHVAWSLMQWRRTQSWFPKGNELRELCLEHDIAARVLNHRILVTLGEKEPMWFERREPDRGEPEPLTPERKAELMSKVKPGPVRDAIMGIIEGA